MLAFSHFVSPAKDVFLADFSSPHFFVKRIYAGFTICLFGWADKKLSLYENCDLALLQHS